MHKFGKKSVKCLKSCHEDIQKINNYAIETVSIDYGIHEGHRTDAKQLEYYLSGKSRIDPRSPYLKKRGMHLRTPSMAFDFHVAEKYLGRSLAWDNIHLTYVAAYLMGIADIMFDAEAITHKLRWGGNWDQDGILLEDQNFDDLPHLELYKP